MVVKLRNQTIMSFLYPYKGEGTSKHLMSETKRFLEPRFMDAPNQRKTDTSDCFKETVTLSDPHLHL